MHHGRRDGWHGARRRDLRPVVLGPQCGGVTRDGGLASVRLLLEAIRRRAHEPVLGRRIRTRHLAGIVLHNVDQLVAELAVTLGCSRCERAVGEVHVRAHRERVRVEGARGAVLGAPAVEADMTEGMAERPFERSAIAGRKRDAFSRRDGRECARLRIPVRAWTGWLRRRITDTGRHGFGLTLQRVGGRAARSISLRRDGAAGLLRVGQFMGEKMIALIGARVVLPSAGVNFLAAGESTSTDVVGGVAASGRRSPPPP